VPWSLRAVVSTYRGLYVSRSRTTDIAICLRCFIGVIYFENNKQANTSKRDCDGYLFRDSRFICTIRLFGINILLSARCPFRYM